MNKKTIFALPLLLIALFVVTSGAEAKSNWDQYFSVDEAKAIKNMVKKSIINEFENPDGDWKEIIGSKLLKDGVIDADKVGDDIAKKKIYTGTYPSSINDADKVVCDDVDVDECDYYLKISIPEIDVNDSPLISLYEKDEYLGDNIWHEDDVSFEDGYAYSKYATSDGGVLDSSEFGEEYKIIISY
ncbi:MAG: hypothetical protein RBS77_02070 [Candidatus Moranbacteria bacterium]|jgi:hypothetical protein|nr:hypothetical protein [Candidatus Moranbacteria bacterium]